MKKVLFVCIVSLFLTVSLAFTAFSFPFSENTMPENENISTSAVFQVANDWESDDFYSG